MLAVAVIHVFPCDSRMALLLLIFFLYYWILLHTRITMGRAAGWVWLGLREEQPHLVSQLVSQGRSNGVGSSFPLSCFMLSLVFHGHS